MINLPNYLKLAMVTYNGMCEQERTGILFDQDKANDLIPKITAEMEAIEAEIEPQLPKRQPLKSELAKMTPPKIQFKKDGTPSKRCIDWFDWVWVPPGQNNYFGKKNKINYKLPYHEPIIEEQTMHLGNQAQLKDWLISLEWEPVYWNFKTEKINGKLHRVKDVNNRFIKTSPKLQEGGKICPGLSRLAGTIQLIEPILEWMTLRHRRSQIQGWLDNPRIKIDGRLPAGASGLANTKRQKHKVVVNVPRVGSVYGQEMRSLFIAPEGKALVGYDASSLEDRIKAHYLYPIDNGEFAEKIMGDYDPHQESADLWGIPRSKAKNGNYALQYFCQPPTLAKTIGCTLEEAEEYHRLYWEKNWALDEFRKRVERSWIANGKKFVLSIDKSKIYTRSQHSLVNCVIQSTGAKIMDMSYAYIRKALTENRNPAIRVGYSHDEYIWETTPRWAEDLGTIGRGSIIKAGKFFKLNVYMDAEYLIGQSWAEVH